MTNLSDLDMLLSVIENPTRRRILEALVREPHYPLQLSRELGMSQQAIMKHLKLLEDRSLVRSFPEESDQGGPTRKRYVPTTQLAMSDLESEEEVGDEGSENELVEIGVRINRLRETVAGVANELEELQVHRARLITIKERALEEAGRLVESQIDDYQVRRIIYEYIQRPELSTEQIAVDLDLRDDLVQQTIRKLRSVG
jgi:predicted transcriptional regulator